MTAKCRMTLEMTPSVDRELAEFVNSGGFHSKAEAVRAAMRFAIQCHKIADGETLYRKMPDGSFLPVVIIGG